MEKISLLNLPDELKDLNNYDRLLKEIAKAGATSHKHKKVSVWNKCKFCQKKVENRRKKIISLGFESVQQYLVWRKTHEKVRAIAPLIDREKKFTKEEEQMNQEESINKLNSIVKLRISPSEIHGVGVFAIVDIPKGTRLHASLYPQAYKVSEANQSKLFPEIRNLLLERNPQMILETPFMWPDCNNQAYMNHSDEPNYEVSTDVALQDIKAGEEVTRDYKLISGFEKVYPFLVV